MWYLKETKGMDIVMKNRLMKASAIVLCMACMAGCGADYSEEQVTEQVTMEFAGTENTSENAPRAAVAVKSEPQQKEDAQGLNADLFDGQSMSIWKGKGNTLVALKEDTFYLYDVASAQIEAQTKTERWNSVTVYPYKSGYWVIGEIMKGNTAGSTAAESRGIFYDDSLKETQTVLLDDIVPDAAGAAWAVSSDGAMFGYYDFWGGLNLYDLESREKQQLLDTGLDGNSEGLLNIDALFFDETDSRLVFTGQTYQSGRSAESWGRIDIDGTGFENYVLEYDLGMATGYGAGKLLLGEDSIFFKNRMGVVNVKTGEAVYHANTENALPVSGPFFSDDGTVYATAALGTNQMEVAVWRTEDFSLVSKEVIRDDREEMFYRSPHICLFPELRVCIVCMGGHNDIPQKAVLLNY